VLAPGQVVSILGFGIGGIFAQVVPQCVHLRYVDLGLNRVDGIVRTEFGPCVAGSERSVLAGRLIGGTLCVEFLLSFLRSR